MKSLCSLFLVIVFTGCANVTAIKISQKNSDVISKMNSSMKTKAVMVGLASGDSLHCTYDSSITDTLFISGKVFEAKAFDFSELKSISYRSPALGAATYAGIGMLAALIIWSKTPEGPGIKIGQGILHWSVTIPFASAWLGYKIGRKERFVVERRK